MSRQRSRTKPDSNASCLLRQPIPMSARAPPDPVCPIQPDNPVGRRRPPILAPSRPPIRGEHPTNARRSGHSRTGLHYISWYVAHDHRVQRSRAPEYPAPASNRLIGCQDAPPRNCPKRERAEVIRSRACPRHFQTSSMYPSAEADHARLICLSPVANWDITSA